MQDITPTLSINLIRLKSKMYLFHAEFLPEKDSPMCLYTQVAPMYYYRTTLEGEWKKDGGLGACP